MPAAPTASKLFVPPYPRRPKGRAGRSRPFSPCSAIRSKSGGRADFERPVSIGRTIFGLRGAAHDPAAVRRIFLDNAANYRKDDLQLRILRPGLGNGLLTAEGEDWRIQRRALAPVFSPRQTAEFAPAVHRVGRAAVERMSRRRDGAVADVGAVMSRLTLEVLEQTLFSQGLGREPSAFQRAVSSYFETIGRIDPLDLLGAPAFVPRLRRRRGRSALEFFDSAVDAIIEKRRALLSSGGEAPRDLLTLLMSAKDPENGRAIADVDMRANIVTFINAGHETTANALTWTLYLLSQSPEWRERAEADADEAFDADGSVAAERCEILRAVFEEALRLYPPAAMLARQAIADDELAGVHIPAGAVIYGLALCPASPPGALGASRRLRSVAIPGRTARSDRPFRLHSVRRGAARVHWHGLRDAGGDHPARASFARLPLRSGRGPCRHAVATGDVAPARGHENARKTARQREEFHSGKILYESPLTEISQGPICASPNDDGRF